MVSRLLTIIVPIVMIYFTSYYSWRYSFGRHPSKKFSIVLGIVIAFSLLYYSYLFIVCPIKPIYTFNHKANIFGLFVVFMLLQILRAILDQLDVKAIDGRINFDKASFRKNVRDLFINITLFSAIYTMILYTSFYNTSYFSYKIAGYTLSAFCIIRVLKFRIYDDLYKRWLHDHGSFIGQATSIPTTLLQGIYNTLFRSYIIISLSFASIYTLLHNNAIIVTGRNIFYIKNESGNIFVDFVYYSIITMSTVGYGDISPITEVPKLICASQILLGYFFIGSTFAYIFFVISLQANK